MPDWLPLTDIASAAGQPARVVAERGGVLLLRRQFLRDVDRWHRAFDAQSGERWALHLDDPCDFAAALYGAWHAGKTPYLPGDIRPATLQRLAARVDGLAGDMPGGLQAAADAGDARPDPPLHPPRHLPLDRDRTRLVLFTSGSSGEPIALDKRLAQLDAEVAALHQVFGRHGAGHPVLTVHSTVSHQHIYGLLFAVLWPLAAGRCIATRRLGDASSIAARLGPAPSLLVSSPAHLKRLPVDLDGASARRALQAVFSSGGPLPRDAALSVDECLGQAPIEIFGSSETGGIAWRQQARDGERWQALPGVAWRIDGELLAVASPFLHDDGWWLTADRALPAGGDGFVLAGRADRIVKIEEKRVSLTAIEQGLCASPWIAEARALPVDAGEGQRIGAVVVLSESGRAALAAQGRRRIAEALRAALADDIERVALPRRWRYVDALPVNSQGKVTEALLAALFEAVLP